MSQKVANSSTPLSCHGASHTLIIGDCRDMNEIADNNIQLVVQSPPYFSAPHDYPNMFTSYEEYLSLLRDVAKELWRVVAEGRIVVLVIDDMLVDGVKYPIVADATRIYQAAGFRYRDRITWKKPDGYATRSRRSGVLVQNCYPMYYYPDNLLESILIFQKGRFDYKSVPEDIRQRSGKQLTEYLTKNGKWHLNLWEITNVLPNSRLEKGVAAFPHELADRLIRLYSYVNDTVLDCFTGSGTTMKAALELERNSVGIEVDINLLPTIKQKIESSTRAGTALKQLNVILRLNPHRPQQALAPMSSGESVRESTVGALPSSSYPTERGASQ
jgi:site-specific DNA-methyltransferase (adenine-specific)